MKKYSVLNVTKNQRRAVFAVAKELGYSIYPATEEFANIEEYPNLNFKAGDLRGFHNISSNSAENGDSDYEWVTLAELFEVMYKLSKCTIQLNSSYEAIIDDNKVIVGCQTFEFDAILKIRRDHKISPESVRMMHAKIFAHVISEFIDDEWLDDEETLYLSKLHKGLSRLGWAPGEV